MRIHAAAFAYPWARGDFEQLLTAGGTHAEGAFRGTQLCGFILSRVAADEAEILTVAVLPAMRRQGLGARLLAANLARLAASKAKSVFLEVDATNTAALALYQAFDFARVGERKAYYRVPGDRPASALIMRRALG